MYLIFPVAHLAVQVPGNEPCALHRMKNLESLGFLPPKIHLLVPTYFSTHSSVTLICTPQPHYQFCRLRLGGLDGRERRLRLTRDMLGHIICSDRLQPGAFRNWIYGKMVGSGQPILLPSVIVRRLRHSGEGPTKNTNQSA